ncbi:MAG: ABC transporter permease subunit [Candidatus Binatia bacterium]
MIASLALYTARECFRRPFPYLCGGVTALLALVSALFLGFSFGMEAVEQHTLVISAVFTAGFLQALFIGTGLIRKDLERGTLGLLLSKPVTPLSYVAGRFAGLALASAALALGVALLVSALFALLGSGSPSAPVVAACARATLCVVVLDAAAVGLGAWSPAALAPIALAGLFLAGTAASASGPGLILPDFGLFGLDTAAAPPWAALAAYSAAFSSIFLLVAYIGVSLTPPLRSES